MTQLDWIQVGAKAAVLTRRNIGADSARLTTITKVGKRDVVTESGERFNLGRRALFGRGIEETGHRDSWSPAALLISADDPQVQVAVTAARISAARYVVDKAHDEWRRNRDVPHAESLIAAARAWIELQQP